MSNPLLNISKPVSNQKFSDVPHSAGIADDFAVRKNIATREGTIEKVPVNSNDITNKAYVDAAVLTGGITLKVENHPATDCTGLDGEENRTLTMAATYHGVIIVNVDTFFLRPIIDFTMVGQVITFLNPLSDIQNISLYYI